MSKIQDFFVLRILIGQFISVEERTLKELEHDIHVDDVEKSTNIFPDPPSPSLSFLLERIPSEMDCEIIDHLDSFLPTLNDDKLIRMLKTMMFWELTESNSQFLMYVLDIIMRKKCYILNYIAPMVGVLTKQLFKDETFLGAFTVIEFLLMGYRASSTNLFSYIQYLSIICCKSLFFFFQEFPFE